MIYDFVEALEKIFKEALRYTASRTPTIRLLSLMVRDSRSDGLDSLRLKGSHHYIGSGLITSNLLAHLPLPLGCDALSHSQFRINFLT